MPRPPYLGAAYYPEDWPREQVDDDIELMLRAGCNVMRLAEFAWSSMEPREGQFEFGWLHDAVDKLGAAGIASILGTPTATPPAWLTSRYPEVLFVNSDGVRHGHGARCHFCPNSPVYRDHVTRIVNRMGEEFGLERLEMALQDNLYKTGSELLAAVREAITKFADGEPLRDDVCLVVVDVTSKAAGAP